VESYIDFGGEVCEVHHIIGEVIKSSRFQEARTYGSVSGGSVHINGRYADVNPPVNTLNTEISYVDEIWVRFPDGQDQEVTIVNANGQFLPGHEIVFSYIESHTEDLYLTSITNKSTMKIVKFYPDNSIKASVRKTYLDKNKKEVRSGQRRFWCWLLFFVAIAFLFSFEEVILGIAVFGFICYALYQLDLYRTTVNAPLNAAHDKYVQHFNNTYPSIVFNFIRKSRVEAENS
jgi:hypothetical protein